MILLSKYKKEDSLLVFPYNELDFIATQSPIINENKEYEFISARIRGELKYANQNLKNINTDKANILYHFDNLDFKTAVLKDGETEAVGFFIADPPFLINTYWKPIRLLSKNVEDYSNQRNG